MTEFLSMKTIDLRFEHWVLLIVAAFFFAKGVKTFLAICDYIEATAKLKQLNYLKEKVIFDLIITEKKEE